MTERPFLFEAATSLLKSSAKIWDRTAADLIVGLEICAPQFYKQSVKAAENGSKPSAGEARKWEKMARERAK
jgi:hypothetical protein